MIPKVLFLALICARHVQGQPVSSHENLERDKSINTWNDEDNTDNANENFKPNASGNSNADFNGDREVAIVRNPSEAKKKVETHQQRRRNQDVADFAETSGQTIDDDVKEKNYISHWKFESRFNADPKINTGLSLSHVGQYRNFETN